MSKMQHWDALKATDPRHTKPVSFGSRKFTSINSQWQIQRMTEHFGPIGKGWGYNADHSIATLADGVSVAVADVSIWWRDGDEDKVGTYGPIRGMAGLLEKGRLDDDAGKKAMTDALTKGLSHLGLSADVFLGLFDDVKYVNRVAQEFQEMPPAKRPASDLVDEADRDLIGGTTQSQYEVNKHKEALRFTNQAVELFKTMTGASDVNIWFATAVSPGGRSTNAHAVARLKENFPDLGNKLEEAADEARLRNHDREADPATGLGHA